MVKNSTYGRVLRSFYKIIDVWKDSQTKKDYDENNGNWVEDIGEFGVHGLTF